MFKIGEFSKMCGLSADTLYHYDKINLLKPSSVDMFTGYRYYEAEQLLTVYKIRALKDAGFSLKEIVDILNNITSSAELTEMLEHKANMLIKALQDEENRLERLHTNIFLIKNGGIPYMNDITIKKTEPVLITSARRTFPKCDFDKNLEEMWPAVNEHINRNGIKRTTPCLMLYHSGWWDIKDIGIESNPETLDVEVAEPIIQTCESNSEINVYALPQVEKMACVIHKGSFSTIGETFERLFSWVKENKYYVNGPIREIYHKGEWVTNNEDEYVTEIQIPLN